MENLTCPKCESTQGYNVINDSFHSSFYCPVCQFSCFMAHYGAKLREAIEKRQQVQAPSLFPLAVKRIAGTWWINDIAPYKNLDTLFKAISNYHK